MKVCPQCQASYPGAYTHCPRDGSALREAWLWQEGTIVRGKYRILNKLGEGGMAVVYKAMHTRFEELRALKVMNAELACDHSFVKRFMHEAVLTRRIQHPNAVKVEDIDEAEDGRPFMVMEFLEGRGLKDVIESEAPMEPARVSRIARQVAGALSAAHSLGVVHRDVKPANILLLSPEALLASPSVSPPSGEQAKVLDFGIAKAREARLDDGLSGPATLTRTGSVIGTPTYMSPEQARGMRGADLDGRSDLYSLGVVMYQMLIGGLPFKAETSMEWILAHLNEPPRPFRELRSDVQIPQGLAGVVMRCLEKDPGRRPASAADLIRELEDAEAEINAAFARPKFMPGTGRTWVNASGSIAGRAPASQSKALRDDDHTGAKPFRRWMGWSAGVLVILALAGGFVIWTMQHSIWRAGATPAPAPESKNSALQAAPQPNGPQARSGQAAGAANGSAPAPAAPPQTNAGASAQSETPTSSKPDGTGARPAEKPKSVPTKPPGFAAAVQRAKDDESQGRFEDALREYQQAAALDPADASVRRHIALLRERISKENDLIR